MKGSIKFNIIGLVIVLSLLIQGIECAINTSPHRKVTLLTYYSDFIDSIMGLIEDIALDFIVPAYQYIKSHTVLNYMFFTLLIMLCVFNILSNFNHIFKSNKKVKFVANQDIPKDSKQLQKQIRSLREAVSYLKQQALKHQSGEIPVQQMAGQNNQFQHQQATTQNVQVQLDPQVEQRIIKNQQNIDSLKLNLMKIVEIQQDLQKSIVESQREVAQDIQAVRTNKPVKKIASGQPHSSQLDSSQQKTGHSNSRQSSTSFLEESNENKLHQMAAEQVIQQQQQQQEKQAILQQQQLLNQQRQMQQNQQKIYTEQAQQQQQQQEEREKPVQQQLQQNQDLKTLNPPLANQSEITNQNQLPPTTTVPQVENANEVQDQHPHVNDPFAAQSAFSRPPPQRPTPFGGRQPPSLMNKKQPVRNMPASNAPVVLPPK
ncbi:transmembrane protein, putative (macronuclear) [Tetrahymena thermophila SB210]|uniref:Transmembrane protein, putative n=1 Tax=Tetrahymena thermophila (strain SB210) TaxID=312017 RepID=I7MJF4_TETTS|nr:transmembrane protein, putative [Tetrahymena thermophila SB210]EAS06225.2 transmembrane protein, putative [Tetrahymena thermophila SB210]|eukprot:XP_001026470.2 transmembrane protein, putative [Tetrahymena thermophila SB210]